MIKILTPLVLILILSAATSAVSLRAQTPPPPDNSAPLLSQADLEQLVAPIALYPDPLIALILTGSTVPSDIVLANRYIQNGGDTNAIDAQNWDDSVKGLARYPDVLKMMDDNLDWTNQLGAAVLAQQADVMTAIQAQRAKAQALGNLQSTPQQQVISAQQAIQIVPADPQVIYVPTYDPDAVYVQPAPPVPFISFGIGLAVGAWLGGDCDWHNHGIYRGGYYRPGYGWGSQNVTINNNNYWRPNPNKPRPRPPYQPNRPGGKPGQLPGWHNPNRPGGPGNRPDNGRPGNTQPGGGNPNRPGGPGNRPDQGKPGITLPGEGNPNRPGGPGNRPDHAKPGITQPGENRPGHVKPAPAQPLPGATRPSRPTEQTKPTTRPSPGFDQGEPNTKRPTHKQPTQPSTQPAKPRPQPTHERPAATRPAAPANRPSFDQQRPNTKRPEPAQNGPARGQRSAPARGGRGDNNR